MDLSEFGDAFKKAREEKGSSFIKDQDESVFMILKYDDVKAAAIDTKSFSSKTEVGRIVIPSEEKIRSTRQYPIETDPPEHTEYRNLLEDWFRRAFNNDYKEKIDRIIIELIEKAKSRESIEVLEEVSFYKVETDGTTTALSKCHAPSVYVEDPLSDSIDIVDHVYIESLDLIVGKSGIAYDPTARSIRKLF